MKLLLTTFLFISSSFAATLPEGVDDLDNVTIEEFLDDFGLNKVDDPQKLAPMEEALEENEEMVEEDNEAYAAGKQTWFDEINDFDDESDDEFIAEHTGGLNNFTMRGFATGLLDIPMEYDATSERYFDKFRYSRADVPASYSAVAEGLVSPIKNQGSCGSCVAFATVALIETCFKKVTGVFGDYSEQFLVDCGYGYVNDEGTIMNYGCKGAMANGYVKWLVDTKAALSSESFYPYEDFYNTAWNEKGGTDPKICPSHYESYSQGAAINGGYWTENGDEETLKRLVAEKGAVLTFIEAHGGFKNYKGGIYAGCEPNATPDHAVAVVGYSTYYGIDYWIIKNSWGTHKGDNGYFYLQRGVKMCGIGQKIVTLDCGEDDARPYDLASSCFDKDARCPNYKDYCGHDVNMETYCPELCGFC